MKCIIFAGGAGTRLWPISRKNSPKQFEKLKDDTSTLQMAVERIATFGMENIYVSTNESYASILKEQVPALPEENIFLEPAKRDLTAAVGLSLFRLKNSGYSGPVAILWADHFVENTEAFTRALGEAENLIEQDPNRFVFLAEKPRFANQNLGWIHLGKQITGAQFQFEGWRYRPELLECEKMFESKNWLWNPGYFITNLDFVLELYQRHVPRTYESLQNMVSNEEKIQTEYSQLEAIHFDSAIVEKIDKRQAVVLKVDLGWSDPGTLYALKEALVSDKDKNLERGEVFALDSKDSFIFNEESGKLVTTIGLEGMMVINTKDALLVCHKDEVPKIKDLLKKIEENGKEKYL